MNKKYIGSVYTLPLTLWLSLFFGVPTLIILVYSFLKKGVYGGVEWVFSLDAYMTLLNPAFLNVVWRTVVISIIATVATILIAVPVSYYVAQSRYKNLFLFLIIVPFWTNFLIRVFAWIAILGNNGFINQFLMNSGLIENYIQLLYNPYAVITVIVYTSLPYAILPLYSTVEKFDFSLLEAARDLGATKLQSLWKIFIPGIKTGIVTAIIFTLIPALGSYAIPQLVGGLDSLMLGNIIARELTINRNWPMASSLSVILTFVTTVGILIFVNMNKKSAEAKRALKIVKSK